MTFLEYLGKNGTIVEQLAMMDVEGRKETALLMIQDWITYGKVHFMSYRLASETAWDLCQEIMVFQHLAQDARAAAEKQDGNSPA